MARQGTPDLSSGIYAGRSAAERAAERRAALLDAAFGLIAEHGSGQLRIERICQAAGLNKRYFYESFTDLDALVAAVLDRVASESIAVTLAAMDRDGSVHELTRAAVGALVRHITDDPRRARVLFGETPTGEAIATHRSEAVHTIVAAAAATGRSIHHLGDAPDPGIEMASAVLVGGTCQAVLEWLDGRLHDDLDAFIDDLAAMWIIVGDAAAMAASP
jgi:AcrR family transcriptional regulator